MVEPLKTAIFIGSSLADIEGITQAPAQYQREGALAFPDKSGRLGCS